MLIDTFMLFSLVYLLDLNKIKKSFVTCDAVILYGNNRIIKVFRLEYFIFIDNNCFLNIYTRFHCHIFILSTE